MRDLERRVEALEAQQEPAGATDVIVVGMVAPGEEPQELQTLSYNDQVWHRQEGETEDQFKERVCREVPRARDCVPVLLSGASA
ncbi:MAG: hypothetical protein DI587_22210 [Variovorax paradoxus]|nr:MAG: hypothetical protein DI583_22210 [Variovorax paradoxus]PZQ06387.1 MAG: hypothetical protein DI587_22210 [Variovorax paradoxus]